MKGVLLAGGEGTRLRPMTQVTNKHMLPVYDKPMIFYPLQTLVQAGIKEIMIITGGEHIGDIAELLGDGSTVGADLTYKVQKEAGGIAQAIGIAQNFVKRDRFAVILGDNIFLDDNLSEYIKEFQNSRYGACLFLKEVPDANRFGVAELNSGLIGIEEKPTKPKSNLAVTGLYLYDGVAFDVIQSLNPSARRELEVTDLNNAYIRKGAATFQIIKGQWTDAGTPESLFRASGLVRDYEKNENP